MSHRLPLFIAALVFAGCPEAEPYVLPPAPKVVSFTATPPEVEASGRVTLAWQTSDATKVSIAELGEPALPGVDDQPSGSLELAAPTAPTLYVLTAENARGARATAVASVTPKGVAQGLMFAAVPELLGPTGTATLVWAAPTARVVSITEGSAPLDLKGQLTSGSLTVNPAGQTVYTLTADGQSKAVTVARTQAITSLVVTPPAARPGQQVVISWTTTNATRVTLSSPGFGVLASETSPAAVAAGNVMWQVPDVDMAFGIPLVLVVEGRGPNVERAVTLFPSAAPVVVSASAPEYARTGSTFTLEWATQGADAVRVLADGLQVYEGEANGSVQLSSPAADTTYSVLAVQRLSGAVSAPVQLTVKPVGLPALVSFTADQTAVAQGGTPVTLTWSVTNARSVTITEEGGLAVVERRGPAAVTGTVVVYPNRPTARYVLEADNRAGDFIVPETREVSVATLATFTFSAPRPVGALTQVTGSTVPDGGALTGLAVARASPPGEAFVDISQDGTPLTFSSTDTAVSSLTGTGFAPPIFDTRVLDAGIVVSTNGWLAIGATTPNPAAPAANIGTTLQPRAMAVFYADLDLGQGSVLYRFDELTGERRLIVQWDGVTDKAGVASLTFQAQLFASGKVVYAYRDVSSFFGAVAAGIVNNDESAVLLAPSTPATGDVISFFGDVALPAPIRVPPGPVTGYVRMGAGRVRVEGDARLLPGHLAITEVNARPGVDAGEWVELSNFSSGPIDLGGFTLGADAGSPVTLAGPLVVPPGGRIVVAEAAQANDGVTTAATYGTRLSLPDGGGGALVLAVDGVSVSRVDLAQPDAGPGISVQADPPDVSLRFPLAATQQLTCPAGPATYGNNGQRGTPGAAHPRCFPYVLVRDAGVPFVSIAASGNLVVAGTSGLSDDTVLQVTPTRPVRFGHAMLSSLWVSTNGFITATSVAPTGTNKTAPSATAPSGGTIAPFWDELVGTTIAGSGIFWQELDPNAVPNDGDESLIVSWERWRVDTTTVNSLDFQVRFWANGDISYHYGNLTAAGTSTLARGSSATAWLEEPSGRAASAIAINDGGIPPNSSFRFVYTP